MDGTLSAEVAEMVPLLAAFDTAAAEGHITHAAAVLGVPQSSLSRRLKSLEQILGVALFQPVGRGVALTAAGRDLHERTRGAVRGLDDAVNVVRSNADPDSGSVRFGFPLTLGPVSIPSLLAEFHETAPRIRFALVQAHGEALCGMVRDGRLDLAVVIPPPDDLPAVHIGTQRILLYVAPSHPLAGRTQIDLTELADERFIANPPDYHLRQLLDTWCMDAGFVPQVAIEIGEFETARALIAQGLGVALLPVPERRIATGRVASGGNLVGIGLTGHRERDIGLIRGNHRPTPAVARLHDHIVRRAGSFLPGGR
ncbi:LysR substrate-binding domain-containing protein [Rhodococcus sp. F64268]|uniref:LysR substrate-binding domain-containing protein n=1 Tax=unclassified Rhodococcus (in: high G+C Gram-positive bacteria) TaxID=192944 RepID=UPI00197F3012|nr:MULTISPECIES: LysR substrate-binding domain-containing protein [unclassified Rhodococcus (in: high G+C Gram-positive bacteria)]MCK0092269.1 LysR substrate-binding domain-containing protein [Rhodococcus sp. F64268]